LLTTFKVLYQHWHGETEENHEMPQNGRVGGVQTLLTAAQRLVAPWRAQQTVYNEGPNWLCSAPSHRLPVTFTLLAQRCWVRSPIFLTNSGIILQKKKSRVLSNPCGRHQQQDPVAHRITNPRPVARKSSGAGIEY